MQIGSIKFWRSTMTAAKLQPKGRRDRGILEKRGISHGNTTLFLFRVLSVFRGFPGKLTQSETTALNTWLGRLSYRKQ